MEKLCKSRLQHDRSLEKLSLKKSFIKSGILKQFGATRLIRRKEKPCEKMPRAIIRIILDRVSVYIVYNNAKKKE